MTTLIESTSAVSPIILDVREPEEYAVSHLPGALRARTSDEALDILETLQGDTCIVLYCSVGYRSSELAAALTEHGFTNVHNLEGSIFEWANRGLPVFHDSLITHTVHPYDEDWGILLHRDLWSWEPDDPDSTHSSQIK
jgi:rhodanese-related sulfurtransferase